LPLTAAQASTVGDGAGFATATTSNIDIQLTYYGADNRVHVNYILQQTMAIQINAEGAGKCQFDVCKVVQAATRGAVAVTGAAATCSEGKSLLVKKHVVCHATSAWACEKL
jgi:hypothetical protein